MKIIYVINDIGSKTGSVRMTIEKANYLAEQYGYDISIISWGQCPKNVFYHVSDKVKQIYLEIPYYTQYHFRYPIRFWKKYILNKELKNKLFNEIYKIDPDFLICISTLKANIISTLKCRAIKIIECHEARYFMTSRVWGQSILSYAFNRFIYTKLYFRTIERNADVVVTLTSGAKQLWHKAKHVVVIPNFSSMTIKNYSNCKKKRIIAVGRLGKEKGFERLLDIWQIVSKRYPDWYLDIYGDGELKEQLKNKIVFNHIRNVTLCGAKSNISEEYSKSSICAVTSYFEGFSLVLLEAIKHGVPCIAYDCPFGPRNIIEDGKCGFLIEEGNNTLFAERLCTLIEDEQLRHHFSKAALERAKFFDTEKIMMRWKKLFEDLITK